MIRRFAGVAFLLLFGAGAIAEDHPCISGTPVGQRPGPYTFIVSTGKERGQLTCYICDTADKPAIAIFARRTSTELGDLTAAIDKVTLEPKNAPLKCWVTFLADDQAKMDAEVVQWGQKHAIKSVPLGVFEDADGPPSYRLNRDAEVTVLLFVKQKVLGNYAFRSGELTAKARGEILKTIPKLLDVK